MTNRQVIDKWMDEPLIMRLIQSNDKNLFVVDGTCYSYRLDYPLGRAFYRDDWNGVKFFVRMDRGDYSVTTSRHFSIMLDEIFSHYGTDDVLYSMNPKGPSLAEDLEAYKCERIKYIQLLSRARVEHMKAYYRGMIAFWKKQEEMRNEMQG